MEPGHGAFDLSATPVARELPAVLRPLADADAALAARADQFDATLGEPFTRRVTIAGSVVDRPRRDVRRDRIIDQRLNEIYLGLIGHC